ncbi:MAG: hypothetical protein IJX51_00705 [Clostridia bacterium]|nr:hypothetical protein [Clostridia bacterium]
MKTKYFVISAIFLFNPLISVFDILPDFIGYYFLMRAFTPTSYIFDNASDLYDSAKRMMLIGIAKFFSVFLLFVTDTTMALVLSFTFAILEIMYGMGMFVKLFDVTSYIRLRYDDNAKTAEAESMKSFSVFFLVAKSVLASLPDLTALTTGNSELKTDLTRFRPILFLLTAIIGLVIGIIWLVKFTGFFKKAFSAQLVERVDREYSEQKIARPGLFMAKDFMFAMKLLCIGVIFTFDMSFDSINYFLDGIFSLLCILAFRFLIKNGHISVGRDEKRLFTVASVHILVNFANFISSIVYFKHGDLYFVYRDVEELVRYLPIQVLTIAESVLLFMEITLIFKLISSYTVPNISVYQRYFAERSIDGFIDEYKERNEQICKSTRIWAAIALIYFVFYTFMRPFNEYISIGNYITSIIFIIYFNKAMGFASDTVYLTIYKYS